MCPIPRYKDDIFISYAHIDNKPLAEGLSGRVETLPRCSSTGRHAAAGTRTKN
jgi:hypothetical protein